MKIVILILLIISLLLVYWSDKERRSAYKNKELWIPLLTEVCFILSSIILLIKLIVYSC